MRTQRPTCSPPLGLAEHTHIQPTAHQARVAVIVPFRALPFMLISRVPYYICVEAYGDPGPGRSVASRYIDGYVERRLFADINQVFTHAMTCVRKDYLCSTLPMSELGQNRLFIPCPRSRHCSCSCPHPARGTKGHNPTARAPEKHHKQLTKCLPQAPGRIPQASEKHHKKREQ